MKRRGWGMIDRRLCRPHLLLYCKLSFQSDFAFLQQQQQHYNEEMKRERVLATEIGAKGFVRAFY